MMHRDCTVPYGEVDGFSTLLGYKTANAAGCKVMQQHDLSCLKAEYQLTCAQETNANVVLAG